MFGSGALLAVMVGTLVPGCGRREPALPRPGSTEAELLDEATSPGAKGLARRDYVARALTRGPRQGLEFLEAAAGRLPEHPDVWIALAGCRCRLGEFRQAASAARRAIRLEPTEPYAHYWLLVALISDGREGQARRAWPSARQAGCIMSTVAATIVSLWPDIGREREVTAAIQRLMAPQGPDPLYGDDLRMEAYLAGGSTAEAAQLARALLWKDGGDGRANIVLGVIALGRGRTAEAERAFAKAKAAGDWMPGHLGLAACRARQLDGRGALYHVGIGAAYDSMAQLDGLGIPVVWSAYPNRRAMWKLVRNAASSEPGAVEPQEEARLLCARGAASYFLGHEDASAADLRRALELDAELAVAREYASSGDLPGSLALAARERPPAGDRKPN